jgi:hypothetical protein
MLKLIDSEMATHSIAAPTSVRGIRPSLLDLRFTGDAWVVDRHDGRVSVCLDNYPLTDIQTLPFDVPSLNRLFLGLRQGQMRCRMYRQLRARRRRALCEAH